MATWRIAKWFEGYCQQLSWTTKIIWWIISPLKQNDLSTTAGETSGDEEHLDYKMSRVGITIQGLTDDSMFELTLDESDSDQLKNEGVFEPEDGLNQKIDDS